MKRGKWIEEESDTRLFCASGTAIMPCFEGQLLHEEVTVVFPAAPNGQVF
jgi:hypothetical protein